MYEKKYINIYDFGRTFEKELYELKENGMDFIKYKQNETWTHLIFDHDFDWTETRDKDEAVKFFRPTDRHDSWHVKCTKDSEFSQEAIKAIYDFLDALKKNPFDGLVRRAYN